VAGAGALRHSGTAGLAPLSPSVLAAGLERFTGAAAITAEPASVTGGQWIEPVAIQLAEVRVSAAIVAQPVATAAGVLIDDLGATAATLAQPVATGASLGGVAASASVAHDLHVSPLGRAA
jgi:hypothetical protein